MNIITQQLDAQEWAGGIHFHNHSEQDLILVFASRELLCKDGLHDQLEKHFPTTIISYCSTSGEILDDQFYNDSFTITYINFEHSTVHAVTKNRSEFECIQEMGENMIALLPKEDLVHIMVLIDGILINSTDFLQGIRNSIPKKVSISGGVAGDGERFTSTLVGLNKQPKTGEAVLIGFYGKRLKVNTGSSGGFDSFGVDRLITKSSQNELFELDGQPALTLYKNYLGHLADGLPGNALLFPLMVKFSAEKQLARTILTIDESKGSMTFAGNMPQGSYARLMRTNPDRLIDAAYDAAQECASKTSQNQLAIIVSCVGRKLILDQRIEEELEAVKETLGPNVTIVGFYSYGEICPHSTSVCELYNQTMTITTIFEV